MLKKGPTKKLNKYMPNKTKSKIIFPTHKTEALGVENCTCLWKM